MENAERGEKSAAASRKVGGLPFRVETCGDAPLERPAWMKIRVRSGQKAEVSEILKQERLRTVCEEATCPNLSECFAKRTATFLILGRTCTRRCPYCDISHGRPLPPDPAEPARLAEAAERMGLHFIVITSVDRDDLKDGGAGHFAACVRELRARIPGSQVEILVPDFRGRMETALEKLKADPPDVFNHNIETVPSLFRTARPGGNYEKSLELLRRFGEACPGVPTKSGIMAGLGETDEELFAVMRDLRAAGVSLLTIGQYLPPSRHHIAVRRYVTPEEFEAYRQKALSLGFRDCMSGPFVRSSYRAASLSAG